MHSSRMRTAHFTGHFYQGLSVSGSGSLFLISGVSASGSREVSASGSMGVCLWVGGVYHKPPSPLLDCTSLSPPSLHHTPFTTHISLSSHPHGQTNTCENTTLSQTSFAVIIWIQIMLRPLSLLTPGGSGGQNNEKMAAQGHSRVKKFKKYYFFAHITSVAFILSAQRCYGKYSVASKHLKAW